MRFYFQQLLAASLSITSVLAVAPPAAHPGSTALTTVNFLKPVDVPHPHGLEARGLFSSRKKPGQTRPPRKDDSVELGDSVKEKQQEIADRKALLEQKKAELEAAKSRAAAATPTPPTVAPTPAATVPVPTTLATVPTPTDKATTASPTTTGTPATTTAASTTSSTRKACALRPKQTGAGGKVRRAPVNEECNEPRPIYRIRMINDFADVPEANTDPDRSAEAQDHCGIFIGDEPSKGGNSGTLHHAMYITDKQIKAYDKLNPTGPALAKDTYVYERRALKNGIVSHSARPAQYQTKLGEIDTLAKLQIVEASMGPIGITPTNTGLFVLGTKSGGFSCQGWTREKLAILKTGRQVSHWQDPPKVKSSDPDLPAV